MTTPTKIAAFQKAIEAKTRIKTNLACDRRDKNGYPLCVDKDGKPLELTSSGCFFYVGKPAMFEFLDPSQGPGLYTWRRCPKCKRVTEVRFTGVSHETQEADG